jgi:hypothetical protein
MLILSGVANRIPTESHKPWIHVREKLIARIWMGLATFSAVQARAALAERPKCSLDNAVGA